MSESDSVGAGTAAGGAVVLKASFPALVFKVFEMFGIFFFIFLYFGIFLCLY